MDDHELMERLYNRFHLMSEGIFSDRIARMQIDDLPFADPDGVPFGNIRHLVRGDDKSGASFDIFRLGWFGGRVWELVIIDGAYLPHVHRKIDSEFFILTGCGHLSRDAEWSPYQKRSRVSVGRDVAHGFITDPEFGPTVFLSLQSDAIRKISTDPITRAETFEDDFVYVDNIFPLPADLLAMRRRKLASSRRST